MLEALLEAIQDKKTQLDRLRPFSRPPSRSCRCITPLAQDLRPFQTLLPERLDATLADYLGALGETLSPN